MLDIIIYFETLLMFLHTTLVINIPSKDLSLIYLDSISEF